MRGPRTQSDRFCIPSPSLLIFLRACATVLDTNTKPISNLYSLVNLMKMLKINNETISKLELMVNLLHSRKLHNYVLSYKAISVWCTLSKVKAQFCI